LTAVGANITVETLDVIFSGSGPFGEVTSCGLWEDADNDGFASTPPDTNLVGWVDPFGGATPPYWTVYGPAKKSIATILDGDTERWLVTFSFGSTVSAGQTYGAVLGNEAGVMESFYATYNAGAFVANVAFDAGALQLPGNPVTIANASTLAEASVPGGVSADQFVMISPSITASPTGGFAQIEAQLGPPGPSGTWRLFRYDETTGTYDEYGEPGFPYATMDVRYGWWFISRRATTLRFQGTSTQGTPDFTLTLPSGVWAQIGNPYNADMPLSYIDVGGSPLNSTGNTLTSRVLYRYAGGGYVAETAAMRPCTGYWVYVITGPATLTFNRPPNALKPGETLSRERALHDGEASPPAPPAVGFDDGDSGGGGCFASAGAGVAGMALLFGLGAAGAAAWFRRRVR
jgi:hypothetical protein